MDLKLAAFIAVVALLFFIGFFSAGYALLRRNLRLKERVRGAMPRSESEDLPSQTQGMLKSLGRLVPRSPKELGREAQKLMQAGFRRKDSVLIFYGFRVIVAILTVAGLALMGMPSRYFLLFIVLPLLAAALVPDLWLSWTIAARKLRLQLALPDMMDLTVVCVEAGLGLDQTLQRVGREMARAHPDLSDELRIYNLEVNAGRSRVQAFRNLAGRTGVDDVKTLAATMIQADRFGTSIADTLRIFSDSLRTKRRQRAEEKAAKMNVKMVLPLVCFIFPAIFIVVAGPAVIAIMRDLLPRLQGQ